MTMFKKNGGFTLVELIVVIAILAILAGVAVPAYSGYIEKANEAADLTTLTAIRTAAQAALAEKGTVDEIVIQTVKDNAGVIGLIKVHVAGDDTTTGEGTNKVTTKNYIYLYGVKSNNVCLEGDALTKTSTDGKLEYVNKDFELFMNNAAPAVLKTNELGTTWYAAGQEVTEGTVPSWVAGWNEVTETT